VNQRTMFDLSAPAQYDDMPLPQPEKGEERTAARARRGDPSGSHAAAAEMNASGAARIQRERVIDLVYTHPGLSSNELAKHCDDLDRFQIARRLPEAEEIGEVHRRKVDGKRDLVWFPGRAT
jgi:hypothetical protein